MVEVINYIYEILGVRVNFKKVAPNKLKKLPFFLANAYEFGEIVLFEQKIILLIVKEDFTTETLRNHLTKVQVTLKAITVAVIPFIDAYKRLRLIEKRIQFIIPGKQMYMPDLLISFKEYGNNRVEDQPAINMQPAAQLLLLYHLQVEPLDGLNLGKIAEKLGYNPMTITRAAFYFQSTGICRIEGTKEKFLKFDKSNSELWKMTEPKMTSPIKKIQFYTGFMPENSLKKCNINALAHYTDINEEPIEYAAIGPDFGKFIVDMNVEPTSHLEGNICIEEWKYNPALLTKTDYVDPLSLFLCFRDSNNERIEMSLEKLINQYPW